MKSSNFILLFLIIIFFSAYKYWDFFWPRPICSEPIEFSIGTIDPRFGLSSADFIKKIEQAGGVWGKAMDKKLFQYNEAGSLKINLIYDSRQQVTDELKKQDIAIDDDKAVYDNLKVKYDALVFSYDKQKVVYDKSVADFQNKQQLYNEQVNYFNNKGGAPTKDYTSLNKEKEVLEKLAASINNMKDKLNSLSKELNLYAQMLNTLAQKLNIKVSTYNNIGASNGDEFSEGEYILDQSGQYINIYQFENNVQLLRILTHELGHALGLEHVTDSKAIMYYLNISSGNITLTSADIAELRLICDN